MVDTARHLTQLATTGLVRLATTYPELEYLLRHALVQDAAYASLLKGDRRWFHARVLREWAAGLRRRDEPGDDAQATALLSQAARLGTG
ncbi:MAG TPA: hypothetical protein VM536_07350 [Chloroflexia bacterium]|nr:hypothetical protein [Chloroflexia bacterium]